MIILKKIQHSSFFRSAVFLFFVFILSLSQISNSYAQGLKIIRDQEIEDLLKNMSEPMFEKAGFNKDDINIIIIESYGINAFVAGGKNIFINTGLMLKTKNAGEILGVIAHELSHISSGHLLRTRAVMENLSLQTLLITIAGAAAAVLASNSGAGGAILKGGQAAAVTGFLKHSRGQEAAADAGAIKFLEAAGISPRGMLDFMRTLQGEELLPQSQQSRYVRTHPLTQDRISFLERAVKNSKYKDKTLPKKWQKSYDLVRAKLLGYIMPERVIEMPRHTKDYASNYAYAIALYRVGRDDEAINLINKLIKQYPENPYLYELKAQVLFEMGKIEASVRAYKKSVDILPSASLIQIAYAHALLEKANKTKLEDERVNILNKAVKSLNLATKKENHNPSLFRFLGIAYGKLGKEGLARLALAEEAILQNRLDDAKRQLSYARKSLPKTSKQALLKLADLENVIENRNKKMNKKKKH